MALKNDSPDAEPNWDLRFDGLGTIADKNIDCIYSRAGIYV